MNFHRSRTIIFGSFDDFEKIRKFQTFQKTLGGLPKKFEKIKKFQNLDHKIFIVDRSQIRKFCEMWIFHHIPEQKMWIFFEEFFHGKISK